jgi:tetratricopeptide (TPR) repeat protein
MPRHSFWEKFSFVVRRMTGCGLVVFLLAGGMSLAQTFEVGQQSDTKSTSKKKSKKDKTQSPDASGAPQATLGWGSGLEVAQQLRAAQAALRAGDYSAASMHAERAAKAAPQNADLWFLFGYAARLAGRYPTSVDAFRRGLAVRPSSVQGLGGLAQTYAKMGRNDEARQLLLQVIAGNPKNPSDLQLAGELFLSSDPQRGLDLLTRSESIQAAPRTELLMSRAYQMLKRPDDAQRFLERARSRAPHDPSVLRAVAAYYRDTRHYDQAISTLREVQARTPDYWAELAYTYQLAGQKNEAADAYLKAAAGAKGEIGYQLGAADAMLNVGKIETATDLLRRAETLDPNHYRLHALRGQLANQQDRLEDAIREYQTAIARLPEAVPEGMLYPIQLRVNLAEVYRASNDPVAATEQVNLAAAQLKSIETSGGNKPEFLRLRAAVESSSGDLDAAEKDLKEALSQDPANLNLMLNYGNLLSKLQRQEESFKMFEHVLQLDPRNRSAITSLGFLSREANRPKAAEEYFSRAIKLFPNDHGPYLALGDVYTSQKAFARAQSNYEKAHQLAPKDPLVISRGANAALEDHHIDLAKTWLDRAEGKMNDNPQVMRERERYLTLTQQYGESAELGEKVVQLLPRDREAPVYLGYDYVFLQRYDDALALFYKYETILPRDKDLWLIAGHSHRAKGDLRQAETDFTEALQRDPNMATGYMNRGFVRNDLKEAGAAVQDFETAIKLRSDYGEAHLGLAMSDLQLHRASKALKEVNVAEKLLGASRVTHMTRGEAFRQRVMLLDAEKEYRAALKFAPNDSEVQLALAGTLFHLRHYQEAADLFRQVAAAEPDNPLIFAHLAEVYAKLHQPDEALRYAQQAEIVGKGQGDVLLATGEMFLSLGDRGAAMQRFTAALEARNGDGVETRLAIARVFLHEGRWEDAREQVALGFAEARIGETTPITPQHLVEAAGIFLSTHEYELAKKYLERARSEGADPEVVALGMTNAFLAEGQTQNAEAQLAVLGGQEGYERNYDFLMAEANMYRQRRRNVQALAAFARADEVSSDDDKRAEQAQYQVAAEEGHQVTDNVSLASMASFAPIFEDINIYTLDAKLSPPSPSSLLPPPRSSLESKVDAGYRLHLQGLPTINGFVEERNAQGRLSFPSRSVVQDRDTYDTTFNTGISPTLRLAGTTIVFNPGIQFTVRRDRISPLDMNQNLFRQFLHLSTGPFMNWISVSGSLMREAGPFTERNLHSTDLSANISFRVGRPWGRTALIAGYGGRDVLFRPLIREYYTTNTYVGLQRRFGDKFRLTVLGDYLRSWRVVDQNWAIAQALRPAAQFEYKPSARWTAEGSVTWSRGEGFHSYDNVQSGFLISYVKPMRGTVRDGDESVPVAYPLRFSLGLQQQQFYNFSGHGSALLPVVRLTF